MSKPSTGVAPLLCAACLNIVGVINVAALHQMHTDDEIYICTSCMTNEPASDVERILENLTPEAWYTLSGVIANNKKWHVSHAYAYDVNPVLYAEASDVCA